MRADGSAESSNPNILLSSDSVDTASILSGTGPQRIDDGIGVAETTKDTKARLLQLFQPNQGHTGYYQYRCEWVRNAAAGTQFSYAAVNSYNL